MQVLCDGMIVRLEGGRGAKERAFLVGWGSQGCSLRGGATKQGRTDQRGEPMRLCLAQIRMCGNHLPHT